MDEFLDALILAERGKAAPDDVPETEFGLHYPLDYVTRTWYKHRVYGIYPRTGGYDDQDAQLMDDWHMMDMRHLYKAAEYDEQHGKSSDALDYPDPSGALDWTGL